MNIDGRLVDFKWETSVTTSSAYYYSNNVFKDSFIHKQTKRLLADVRDKIDAEFD